MFPCARVARNLEFLKRTSNPRKQPHNWEAIQTPGQHPQKDQWTASRADSQLSAKRGLLFKCPVKLKHLGYFLLQEKHGQTLITTTFYIRHHANTFNIVFLLVLWEFHVWIQWILIIFIPSPPPPLLPSLPSSHSQFHVYVCVCIYSTESNLCSPYIHGGEAVLWVMINLPEDTP